jgi:hypothetical protein
VFVQAIAATGIAKTNSWSRSAVTSRVLHSLCHGRGWLSFRYAQVW